MRMLLVAIAAAAMLASPAAAQELVDPCAADEADAAEAPPLLRLEHDGRPGVWLPSATARHAFCAIRFHATALRVLRLYDDEATLRDEQVPLLREQLALAVQARDVLGGVLEHAERRAREAEERADSTLRSPVLWYAAGALSVVAVALAARWLL